MQIALISDAAVGALQEPLARLLAEQDIRPEYAVVRAGEGALPDLGSPELSVLIFHARELAPELFCARTLLAPPALREAICERVVAQVMARVLSVRDATGAAVLVADFAAPVRSPLGIQDAAVELGLRACIRRINDALEAGVRGVEGAAMLARAAAQARLGAAHVDPAARWRLGMEESPGMIFAWAREIGRHVAALRGRTRRALVLDLDNTLWGGSGDEIVLAPSGRGRAWYDFQQACLDLRDRGVRLAIAAKGDRDRALAVLAAHPHCLLRPEDFDAVEIGWDDKAASCMRIAGRLGLGLSELAFFDDNPVERQWIASALPQVEVVAVPRDPARFVDALWGTAAFESARPRMTESRRLWLVA